MGLSDDIASARLNRVAYRLARHSYIGGSYGTLRNQAIEMGHTLYTCDRDGLICNAVHSEILVIRYATLPDGADESYYDDPANWQPVLIELKVDEAATTLSIMSDGQIVYTYYPGGE
jgi:hypothetical protein